MLPLHPNVPILWRVQGVLSALFFGVSLGVAEFVVTTTLKDRWLPPPFIGAGAVFALFLTFGLVMPGLQYRRWRYAIRNDDVLITYGVVWRVRRCIPRLRIQHVDISSGPIQRMLGLVSLNLYTAGAMGSVASIPGITAPQAERIREQLIGEVETRG